MISLTSTWGSALAITTAPVEPAATSAAGERDQRRGRPAMVVRRLPATEDEIDLGPSDDLHPAGRLDIYL
ncbi:hypothetical protein OG218_04250 [Kineococcus sp. NBC_00420]|uniref:hypothetical protein n=1 Tax=Kineococcus sp. NBC_00420 TaxID=2903564 RepID=UPI002E1C758D